MKKISKILIMTLILLIFLNIKVIAHGGNITGWKDKNSSKITQYNGKYYGYHSKDGNRHYHMVEWNEQNQKWEIIKTAVCYDEKFNIINTNSNEGEKIEVKYSKSVDGDTAKFELDGQIITVRFLGIDTPETVHPSLGEQPYGKEASNFTKEKLENATKIELEYDTNCSKLDKYERHLAWVFVDGILLQEELITNGLATTYMLQDNYKYAWILQEKQEVAKEKRIGMWSNEEQNNTIIKNNNLNNKNLNMEIKDIIIVIIVLIITAILYLLKRRQAN